MRSKVLSLMTVCAMLLGPGAPPALAAERVEASARLEDAGYVNPGTTQYTGNWARFTIHLRGAQSWERWEGTPHLQGDASMTNIDFNAHMNCNAVGCSVSGAIQVTWRSELDAFEGGWVGTSNLRIVGFTTGGEFRYEGVMVGTGWGELQGWGLFANVSVDESGTKSYTGYALAPDE